MRKDGLLGCCGAGRGRAGEADGGGEDVLEEDKRERGECDNECMGSVCC